METKRNNQVSAGQGWSLLTVLYPMRKTGVTPNYLGTKYPTTPVKHHEAVPGCGYYLDLFCLFMMKCCSPVIKMTTKINTPLPNSGTFTQVLIYLIFHYTSEGNTLYFWIHCIYLSASAIQHFYIQGFTFKTHNLIKYETWKDRCVMVFAKVQESTSNYCVLYTQLLLEKTAHWQNSTKLLISFFLFISNM